MKAFNDSIYLEALKVLIVTNKGEVFNLDGSVKAVQIDKSGYANIRYKHTALKVHRLVAFQHIPRISGANYINHKDWNKLNNLVDNLEWVTNRENIMYDYENNKRRGGHGQCMLTNEQVKEIRESTKQTRQLAKEYGMNECRISSIRNGHKYKWVK